MTPASRPRVPAAFRRLAAAAALLALASPALVPPARAQAPTATVRTDRDASGMRVVITLDMPVSSTVIEETGRLIVRHDRTVAFDPVRLEVGGDVLRSIEGRDGRDLVLELGPGYLGFDRFELRNPSRLILDLRGRTSGASPAPAGPRTVDPGLVLVVDPGHGGVEDGARGPGGLVEKDVTLDLARRLKRALADVPGLTVVLTRDDDRLLGLDERTAIANHNRADLFLSVHLNASPRGSARGAETYFLSAEATDDDARRVAAMESRLSGVDESAPAAPAAAADDLELVLWDLAQNRHLDESSRLGERIQKGLNELAGTRDRGVRQAPFRVLMGATMPAVLVEVGFISNPEEEALLRTSEYRDRIVSALDGAIRAYLADLQRLVRPEPTVRGSRP